MCLRSVTKRYTHPVIQTWYKVTTRKGRLVYRSWDNRTVYKEGKYIEDIPKWPNYLTARDGWRYPRGIHFYDEAAAIAMIKDNRDAKYKAWECTVEVLATGVDAYGKCCVGRHVTVMHEMKLNDKRDRLIPV